jgi:adenylate cyclase
MTGGRVERRLAAVLAADVAGYGLLMGADEVGTLEALKSHRREVVDPAIAEYHGRIVKTTGDGMLVEFASAVDAVTCAMGVQGKMAERNGTGSPQIAFRIGINVGDIIIEGDDIFGDGVNIAARVESECEPGRVYLSDDAFRQVRGKTAFAFDDIGERMLKNIDHPVRIYAVRPHAERSGASSDGARSLLDAGKPLTLPDKPSIAVLPFQNLSGDPTQDYFADGVVEDIITALSQFSSLFVIARNSSFTYKGRTVDVKQVGRELGVRYVLEGSVRKSGSRVRITGQLIEAATGAHLWAEKIDGALKDVFALQDEVTARVTGAIEPSITQAEIDRARVKPTSNLDAYDWFLRALPPFYQFRKDGSEIALDYLHRAIALDPGYALAKALLAFNTVARWIQGWGEPGDREKGMALAREAIADDANDPSVLRWAGPTLAFWGDHDRALAVLEKAARLNANDPQVLNSLGWALNYACIDPDRAISIFERALRVSPRDPEIGYMFSGIAMAHQIAGRDHESLLFAQKTVDDIPWFTAGYRTKIVCLVNLGRLEEAKAVVTQFLTIDPGFTISGRLPVFRDKAFQRRYYGALVEAGLPE